MTLIRNYLCDVVVIDKIYTVTQNNDILSQLEIESGEGIFDFRSKKYIYLDDTTVSDIRPFTGTPNFNPYLDNTSSPFYSEVIKSSIDRCKSFLKLSEYTFTNAEDTELFNKYNFCISVVGLSPYFDSNTFAVALEDTGTLSSLLDNEFHILQRIAISPLMTEIGISLEDLQNKNIVDLISSFKNYWGEQLNNIRKIIISNLNDKKTNLKFNEDSIDYHLAIREIGKEIEHYNSIDISKNLESIEFAGDVYRYFPFNSCTDTYIDFLGKLAVYNITSVNRWHHKLLTISKKIFPSVRVTYYDIEVNSSQLVKLFYEEKTRLINKTKEQLIEVLDNEIKNFASDVHDESIQHAILDIEDMKKLVSNVEIKICMESSLPEICNYWPPILGTQPAIFS